MAAQPIPRKTETLNQLSTTVATALDQQATIDTSIRGEIMVLNQIIDLVQKQVDILWQLAQLDCEWKTPALCVTNVPYENFIKVANLSRELSLYLAGEF